MVTTIIQQINIQVQYEIDRYFDIGQRNQSQMITTTVQYLYYDEYHLQQVITTVQVQYSTVLYGHTGTSTGTVLSSTVTYCTVISLTCLQKHYTVRSTEIMNDNDFIIRVYDDNNIISNSDKR